MRCSPNSRRTRLRAALAVLVSACLGAVTAEARQGGVAVQPGLESDSSTRRQVKIFDFNERPLGNFEKLPMFWTKLRGPGLPEFARGELDADVGHLAPPSFRLRLKGGNVAYAYKQRDLAIEPQSDYLVVGFVKVQGLEFSRAFIAASFLDRFGDPIAGSHRVSDLAGPAGAGGDEWQRLELVMAGKFRDATAMRLDLWIAQAHVWSDPDLDELDPIIRQDIHGVAWFDDIAVYRLPRAGLKLSNPGGIVMPGRNERLVIEAHNFTRDALQAVVRIEDAFGKTVLDETREVPDGIDDPIEVSLPPSLSAGSYRAFLDLRSGGETLLKRTIGFSVLAPLPQSGVSAPEFGIDLGRWRGGDIDGLSELLGATGCGRIKIGVPAIGGLTTDEKIAYFEQISTLLRQVEQQHSIRQTGVILTQSAAVEPDRGDSTRSLTDSDLFWRKKLNPILAHFGGLFKAWQLGDETIELRNGGRWTKAQVERVRDRFRRFVTTPRLVVPAPADAGPGVGDVRSVWVPAAVPAHQLPGYLSFLGEPIKQSVWLRLETQRNELISSGDRIADLARRITLAMALAPDQLYVDPPFELTNSGGDLAWQPNESYHVVRTLFHYLTGKRAVGVLDFDDDVAAIIYTGNGSGCVVMWTWHEASAPVTVRYYLGQRPLLTDLWGNQQSVEVNDGLAVITLSPMPVIIDNVNPALARLHASFDISPTDLQAHTPEPKPVLSFRNYYDQLMTGTVTLAPPSKWDVEPRRLDFSLQPGQLLASEMSFTIPPLQLATVIKLGVKLEIRTPETAELDFIVPMKLGLAEITVTEIATIEDGKLIVEQTLKNESAGTVRFSGFCQAVGRPRIWRDFRGVLSGDIARQTYIFRNGEQLRGTLLHMGLREIRGSRTLDKLVEVK